MTIWGIVTPAQTPAVQTSFDVLGSPSSHDVPSPRLVDVVVLLLGVQIWQALPGFTWPHEKNTPSTKQPATQAAPLHISPAPHDVPAGCGRCAQVPAPSQLSLVHGLLSSVHALPTPTLKTLQPPLPSHTDRNWHSVATQEYAVPPHVPAAHTSFAVHALPSLQEAPSTAAGFEHLPLFGSHVPAT